MERIQPILISETFYNYGLGLLEIDAETG